MWRRAHGRPRSRSAVVRSHRVSNLARIRALGLTNRVDDDVRRRQRPSLFGQTAAESLHELIVDLLAAELAQQATHFGDVLLVAAALFGALLQHRGAAWRPPLTWWSTSSRGPHTWTRWPRSSGPWRARSARRAGGSVSGWRTGNRRRKLGLELASSATPTTARRSASTWTSTVASELFTAMFATRGAAAIAVELAVRIQIVGFEIAIDTFSARACCSAPRSRLNHHQRRFVLLRNLRRRQPSLLQRGKLAEQRFLQRPTHTLSLRPVKFVAVSAQPSMMAAPQRAMPDTLTSIKGVKCAHEPVLVSVATAAV